MQQRIDEIMELVEEYHQARQHGTPECKITTRKAILEALGGFAADPAQAVPAGVPDAVRAALFAARGALQHLIEGGKPTESLFNATIQAIDSAALTAAAPVAVAVPDEREAFEQWFLQKGSAHQLERNEAKGWYENAWANAGWEAWQARAALAATPAAPVTVPTVDTLPTWVELSERVDAGETLSPLEQFVYDNEYADPGANEWRRSVVEMVAHYATPAAPAAPAADATTLTPRAHFIKGWDAARMHLGMQGSVDSDRAMRKYMAAIPSSYVEAPTGPTLAAAPVVLPEKVESVAPTLRAMALNYTPRHCWDHLDADACLKGAAEIDRLRALLAGVSAPAAFGDEDHVSVPRSLIGAACAAIDKKRDGVKTLAELRRYTTGDLSAAVPAAPAVVQTPVLYVSKGQLDNHRDPDGPDSSVAGRYLPARITPAGKFTTPLFAVPHALTPAARDVLAERARQISAEGYDPGHDDEHGDGSLSIAAACYALADEHGDGSLSVAAACYALANVPGARPGALSPSYLATWVGWGSGWFKPSTRRRNLEKACALILAEMDRIDRAAIAAQAAAQGGAA